MKLPAASRASTSTMLQSEVTRSTVWVTLPVPLSTVWVCTNCVVTVTGLSSSTAVVTCTMGPSSTACASGDTTVTTGGVRSTRIIPCFVVTRPLALRADRVMTWSPSVKVYGRRTKPAFRSGVTASGSPPSTVNHASTTALSSPKYVVKPHSSRSTSRV